MLKKLCIYLITIVTVINLIEIDGCALYAFKLTGRDAQYFQEVLDYVDEQVANDGGTGNKMLGDISTQLGYTENAAQVEKQLFATLESGEYIFNIHVYEGLKKGEKKDTMDAFLLGVQSKNFSVDAKQKISYALQEIDDGYVQSTVTSVLEGTTADVVGALQALDEVIPVVRVVLGVVVVFGAFGFVFMLIFDLLYVNLQFLQKIFPPDEDTGFKPATRTARAVVISIIKNGSAGKYNNASLLYLKKQAVFCVVYVLILSALATGSFSDVILHVVKAFT